MKSILLATSLLLTVQVSVASRLRADEPQTPLDRRTPIVRAVQQCAPAVVNIATQRETMDRDPFFLGLPDIFLRHVPRDMFERRRVSRSLGSGVLIHHDGYIVTNAHVVQQSDQIKVVLADKREFDGELVSADVDNDLAIIKISDDKPLPFARLGTCSDLMIGETVIAIGNPLGYANTVSAGIVSATDRTLEFSGDVTYSGLIQTDTAINPGNSGGALLNIHGEVIGINTAIRADAEGLSFAIPVDHVRNQLAGLLSARNTKRLWLGLDVKADGRRGDDGLWLAELRITEIESKSPADTGGLQAGDVIVGINGSVIESIVDFETALLKREVGDEVEFKIRRGDDRKAVTVTLGEAPKRDGGKLALERIGLHVSAMTEELAKRFRTAVDYGALVTGVEEDSPAAKIGFQAGDVLIQVGPQSVRKLDDLAVVLARLPSDGKVTMRVVRGRYAVRVSVPVRGKPEIRH
ncbi:MAG: trypsin-like peptidase domain-containing protein [Planctomycetes bacterium]|nr:trypsin-like peptidase domain-containing protein [Planctomycetota bacterium]